MVIKPASKRVQELKGDNALQIGGKYFPDKLPHTLGLTPENEVRICRYRYRNKLSLLCSQMFKTALRAFDELDRGANPHLVRHYLMEVQNQSRSIYKSLFPPGDKTGLFKGELMEVDLQDIPSDDSNDGTECIEDGFMEAEVEESEGDW